MCTADELERVGEECMEFCILLKWGLLQAVKRLQWTANKVRALGIAEVSGYLHEDFLVQVPIEEPSDDIHLVAIQVEQVGETDEEVQDSK